ncbi:RNA polymerase sigma factor [Demequina aurantiaca]|uniref:RNA polymerase sigma factor n=1 Tax=Demequina aurantiaca TaxID=676200 RepID=UPI003D330D2F
MSIWADTLDTLVRERGSALFGYAYVLTGNRHAADDLVQDALIRTFRKGRGDMPLNAAHAYVKRAMLTAFIDGGRRAKARPSTVPHEVAAADAGAGTRRSRAAGLAQIEPDQFAATDARLDLYRAIITLPPRQRACLVMRYVDGLNAASIARELGLAPGTVRKYLSEAVVTLRARAPEWAHDHDDVVDGGADMTEVEQTGAQR